jgi:ubiquinone/menaquinone biosynthesis C-methylase UbiE
MSKHNKLYSWVGRLAGLYNFFSIITGYRRSVAFFIRELSFDKESVIKVLDAGCGTGPYTFEILSQYPQAKVVAFDFSPEIIESLRDKLDESGMGASVKTFSADINGDLKELKGEKFDLIITAGVLEYVPLEETVTKLMGHLKEGGYFLYSPVKNNWWGRFVAWAYHCKPYSRERGIQAFTSNNAVLEKNRSLPSYWLASFKEMQLFRLK